MRQHFTDARTLDLRMMNLRHGSRLWCTEIVKNDICQHIQIKGILTSYPFVLWYTWVKWVNRSQKDKKGFFKLQKLSFISRLLCTITCSHVVIPRYCLLKAKNKIMLPNKCFNRMSSSFFYSSK